MGDGIKRRAALRGRRRGHFRGQRRGHRPRNPPDVILLEKNLMVLEEGVLEGRKVFVNILKYIRMAPVRISATCSASSAPAPWLPYVPMAPIQS